MYLLMLGTTKDNDEEPSDLTTLGVFDSKEKISELLDCDFDTFFEFYDTFWQSHFGVVEGYLTDYEIARYLIVIETVPNTVFKELLPVLNEFKGPTKDTAKLN